MLDLNLLGQYAIYHNLFHRDEQELRVHELGTRAATELAVPELELSQASPVPILNMRELPSAIPRFPTCSKSPNRASSISDDSFSAAPAPVCLQRFRFQPHHRSRRYSFSPLASANRRCSFTPSRLFHSSVFKSTDDVDLGTACGKYFHVSCLSIIDAGDSDIIKSLPGDTVVMEVLAPLAKKSDFSRHYLELVVVGWFVAMAEVEERQGVLSYQDLPGKKSYNHLSIIKIFCFDKFDYRMDKIDPCKKLANLGMKEHLVLPPPPPQTTQPPPALGSGEKSQSSKPYHNIYQHPPPPKLTEGLFKNGSAASRCHFCVEPSRAREAHTFHKLELELEIEARGELEPSFELEYISRARA
ncbi:hypothetical protein LXL04_036729 [Taraxacum kok-saghyz]